jgi:isopentenyldiphosphate isomerase
MPLEYLDILDENGNKTGEIKDYFTVHKTGLIHKVAHVYILNSKGELLLQQRNHDRVAFPNYWDISSAGHVSSGQTSVEAAQKETFEELGLSIPLEAFKYFHSGEEHLVLDDGKYINNEFQDAFVVRLDALNSEIKIDPSEVAGTKWVSIEDFKKMIADTSIKLVAHDVEFNAFLKYLNL